MADKKKSESASINNNIIIRELRNISLLLKDLLIVKLGSKSVKQTQIREILKVDMRRVTRILKCFKD